MHLDDSITKEEWREIDKHIHKAAELLREKGYSITMIAMLSAKTAQPAFIFSPVIKDETEKWAITEVTRAGLAVMEKELADAIGIKEDVQPPQPEHPITQ